MAAPQAAACSKRHEPVSYAWSHLKRSRSPNLFYSSFILRYSMGKTAPLIES
jgi:hypothetical protein